MEQISTISINKEGVLKKLSTFLNKESNETRLPTEDEEAILSHCKTADLTNLLNNHRREQVK